MKQHPIFAQARLRCFMTLFLLVTFQALRANLPYECSTCSGTNPCDCDADNQRLHTVLSEDGQLTTYAYERGSWLPLPDPVTPGVFTPSAGSALRLTETRGIVSRPEGVAFRTLRLVSVRDAAGNEVLRERHVFTGDGYARLDWTSRLYDARNRLLREAKSNGEQTETTWSCCAKEAETRADGQTWFFAYDSLNRLLCKMLRGAGTQPDVAYDYAYDAYGRLKQVTIPAGAFTYERLAQSDLVSRLQRPNGLTTTWSYEANRNLLAQVRNGDVSTYGYVNDALGRRASMSRAGSAHPVPDVVSYAYNDRDELTGASSDRDDRYVYAYAYAPIGNRLTSQEAGTSQTYHTNNLNQYTQVDTDSEAWHFGYDYDGNMAFRPVAANATWTQLWNAENRLVETTLDADRFTFSYDYLGRRCEKCVFSGDTLVSRTLFVYDGFKCIAELDALNGNAVLRRHTWQPRDAGHDVILATTDDQGTHYFLHDANKNVMQKTSADGQLEAAYHYAPFGESLGNASAPVGFSSEVFDNETETSYFNYRYYSSSWGRWLSIDPIFNDKEKNLLCFCLNQPQNLFDKNGLVAVDSPYYIISKERGKIYLAIDICTIHLIVGHNNPGKLGLNSLKISMYIAKDGTKCGAISLLGCSSEEIDRIHT